MWNIAPECTAAVVLSIIWVYARRGSALPNLKNRLFQCCFTVTMIAMVSSILSTVMVEYHQWVPLWLLWLVNILYFIFIPLMGMAYYLYSVAVTYDDRPGMLRAMKWGALPGCLYLLFLALNPFTKLLFDITPVEGYVRGPWIVLTYLVFYAYCIICLVTTIWHKKWLDDQVYRILAAFPILAFAVILIQQLFPDIILTGSAATCALLIIYLHLQNRQISIDHLTGLPNRQELLNMMDMLIRNPARPAFTIVVLSLREFRQINDTYGQQNGDAFLKAICAELCEAATPFAVYRFNGDEFALLVKDGDSDSLRSILDFLQSRMTLPWSIRDCTCTIPAAIGIANYPASAQNLESLVNGIEYAVAKAKRDRSGNICYCNQKMLNEIQRKSQIASILKERCANGGFELYYQPIYSVDSKTFCFAESLMRLNDTPIGPISPAEFIPVAEETGVIIELTYQILDRVCKFVNRLDAQGLDVEAVHVNFSAVQFNQKNLAERVCGIIRDNKTPFSKIKIEFTESAIAENPETVTAFAREMNERGLRLGLDDFGIGYSNIVSVLNIPFGTIKLDKSLVWSAVEYGRSNLMVKNIARIFHEMGMRVLAEGVETEEQNRFVIDSGMELIQGFLYARPMSEAAAERFWLDHAGSAAVS